MTELSDHFPLNTVAPHLMGFGVPAGSFDPAGDWELWYGIYSIGTIRGDGGMVGKMRLRRKALAGGEFTLSLDYEKGPPKGYRQKILADMHCRTDALATPIDWTYECATLGPDGKAVENTGLKKSGAVRNGGVEIVDGGRSRRVELSAPLALHWALFEAVGRLPRTASEPLRFTLLDHFDQVKPNQRLSFRETADVLLGERMVQKRNVEQLEKGRITKTVWAKEGGQTVRLHAFDHVGEGIVPWVYWVDDQGRLLFAIAGLEAYLLAGGGR